MRRNEKRREEKLLARVFNSMNKMMTNYAKELHADRSKAGETHDILFRSINQTSTE